MCVVDQVVSNSTKGWTQTKFQNIIVICTVGVKKKKRFVSTLQKYYSTLYINYNAYYAKLQIVLQKTTDRTTQNYRSYYTKLQIVLHKTTNRAANT